MTTISSKAAVFEMTVGNWDALGKSGELHKYGYGHAAIVSGPPGQGGAARLAARGALRIGAGVVSVICDTDARAEHAAHLNAVMVKAYPSQAEFIDHIEAINPQALCIGPNLGLAQSAQTILSKTLSLDIPMCIDADAITLLADPSVTLPAIINPQSVMTPHMGELRRFIPEVFSTAACRVSLAQSAATKAGCVVLLKGAETVIASPDRSPIIVSSQPFQFTSWLATAGSGDVLAGFVTGLLARGFDGFDAASISADLHFRCADAFGPGLIAEDIPEMLPRLLR